MLLTKQENFKQQDSCAECFARALSRTANRSSLDIIDHTHQLGKFTVARPFFAQALGQTMTICCQVVLYLTFLTKTLISSNS